MGGRAGPDPGLDLPTASGNSSPREPRGPGNRKNRETAGVHLCSLLEEEGGCSAPRLSGSADICGFPRTVTLTASGPHRDLVEYCSRLQRTIWGTCVPTSGLKDNTSEN